MPFSLFAYRGAALTTATETALTAIADPIATIQNSRLLLQRDMDLLYAAGISSTPTRLFLQSPSLRQITALNVRPLIDDGARTNGIRVADYIDAPPLLRALEEITVTAEQESGAGADFTALLALGVGRPITPTGGRPFVMRGTSATAVTADVWSGITVTWPDTLPNGVYSVTGLTHFSANARAARLIFDEQFDRPGTPSIESLSEISPGELLGERLGEFGRFNSNRMPNVEVLADAADSAHEVYLTFRRVS